MKLQRLQIQGYKNLDNIEVDFKKSLGQALVVGTNGSGKSNLLEAISAIFAAVYNHDANIYPDFRFELEYTISNPPSTINGQRIVGPTVFVRIRNVDEIIKRQHKNLVDIMTYDDLLERLRNILTQIESSSIIDL